ncbi:hypothetical protein Rhe02_55550 [Rhizocola hellebori]|uniref:Uncharacterized protein n=1 Tax=Rhizocola hellebori TaxID=1392758 RepID=A0A8J3QAY9_9ACTN|nr:hypothetical protein [Rhizocola hellebori]GIH07488.1 hypothetical protein Rhe02_55550 [Rhizocola hellebori]
MSKHTYGFPGDTDHTEATESAVSQARRDGFLKDGEAYTTEIAEHLVVVVKVEDSEE